MGRYYSGDIEGKFWFGVQSSTDASFFGGIESEPNHVNYYFDKEEHLDEINEGIKKCNKKLSFYKVRLDKFFKDNNGYNDDMLIKEFGITQEKVKFLLEWYARLLLGEKIKAQVEKTGECNFEAEL